MERVMGIEPTYPAWKAGVLPLNYTRIYVKHSAQKSLLRNAQNRNRTSDTRIFSPLLYLLSYLGLRCEILVVLNTTDICFTTWLILTAHSAFVKYYFKIFIVFLFVQFYRFFIAFSSHQTAFIMHYSQSP